MTIVAHYCACTFFYIAREEIKAGESNTWI